MAKKTIKDLIESGKNKSSTIQSLGIQVPSLVSQQKTTDALVYTVIEIIDEGTTPDGVPSPTNISFCLPPPTQIIDLHSANWEGVPFGEKIARLNDIRNGNSPIPGAVQSVLDFVGKSGQDLYNLLVKGQDTSSARDKLLRSKILMGDSAYNAYSIGTATAINPNVELAFRSANLRNMQLNFRLVPLSQQDANEMQKFMDRLKLMMYAKSDFLWATGYPAKFTVQVKTNGSGGNWSNKVLFSLGKSKNLDNKYSSCVLTDFQVSYGDGGMYAGHYDGSPGVIDLNLTFQEATLSTRESIQQEYEIKSI